MLGLVRKMDIVERLRPVENASAGQYMYSELYLPASIDSKIRRNGGRCDRGYMELLRDVTILYTYWFIPPPPE